MELQLFQQLVGVIDSHLNGVLMENQRGGVVAVSSIGTQNHSETKAAFLYGYDAMLERLQPKTILFYGNVPKECKGNIVHIPPFYEKFKR